MNSLEKHFFQVKIALLCKHTLLCLIVSFHPYQSKYHLSMQVPSTYGTNGSVHFIMAGYEINYKPTRASLHDLPTSMNNFSNPWKFALNLERTL